MYNTKNLLVVIVVVVNLFTFFSPASLGCYNSGVVFMSKRVSNCTL